jgi:hypothetical protein
MRKNLLCFLAFMLTVFVLPAQVVINEYSCSNLTSFPDNNGEYEDFIELYNTSSATVAVGGYYLSDNPEVPTKYMIPSGLTITAHGFMRFWCSGRDQFFLNHIHTNFKLTQTKIPSESIVFSDPSGIIIEQHTLEITQKGHSRGRVLDGDPTWGVFTTPTPNASNNSQTAYSE